MNYIIGSTHLGFEGHGIFTVSLELQSGCVSQFTPRLCGFSCKYIEKILKVLEVESWEEVQGKYCRYSDGVLYNLLDDKNFIDLKKVI